MMTPEEYKQLKAYARIDGVLLGMVWIASFACYVIGMRMPALMMTGMIIAISSLFIAATRVKKFRDYVLDGTISFGRGYAYSILIFFYAALIFAAAQFVYFQFLDNGNIMSALTDMMNEPQNKQIIDAYKLKPSLDESLKLMAATRPIDYALNYLSVNIIIGLITSLPIATVMKKS